MLLFTLESGCEGKKLRESSVHYRQFIKQYSLALRDVESFNSTIMNFIYYYLSDVENMNRNSYVAALQEFLENPRRDKLIANPLTGTGFYINADPVVLRHIPRETKEGSGEYRIYECYEAKLLQTMLKMDFYRALEAGHVIRRCEFCGRFFLLKRGYHTKYCDQPNPENPRYIHIKHVRKTRKKFLRPFSGKTKDSFCRLQRRLRAPFTACS